MWLLIGFYTVWGARNTCHFKWLGREKANKFCHGVAISTELCWCMRGWLLWHFGIIWYWYSCLYTQVFNCNSQLSSVHLIHFEISPHQEKDSNIVRTVYCLLSLSPLSPPPLLYSTPRSSDRLYTHRVQKSVRNKFRLTALMQKLFASLQQVRGSCSFL